MRKCLRCNVEMIENIDIKVEGAAYGLKVTEPGIFKDNLGKVKCAVCPDCGYLEMYIDDTNKIEKLNNKKDNKQESQDVAETVSNMTIKGIL